MDERRRGLSEMPASTHGNCRRTLIPVLGNKPRKSAALVCRACCTSTGRVRKIYTLVLESSLIICPNGAEHALSLMT